MNDSKLQRSGYAVFLSGFQGAVFQEGGDKGDRRLTLLDNAEMLRDPGIAEGSVAGSAQPVRSEQYLLHSDR